MNNERGSGILKEIISWVICLGLSALCAYLLITFVFRLTIVKGESMDHTLATGQTLYVDKLFLRFSEPKRGDIVIVEYPGSDESFVKRVVGMPGEKIYIKDSKVYINGNSQIDVWNGSHVIGDMDEVTVPENSYFVMGDNRSNSKDSRSKSVGTISRDHIIGRAVFRVYPFSEFGKIEYQY